MNRPAWRQLASGSVAGVFTPSATAANVGANRPAEVELDIFGNPFYDGSPDWVFGANVGPNDGRIGAHIGHEIQKPEPVVVIDRH